MRPGDRLVCSLIHSRGVGSTFTAWPLHVTIVPWFRIDIHNDELATDLELIWDDVKPFDVVMGEENVQFGHQKGKLATLVRIPSPFSSLESRLRNYLHHWNAWIVDETTKIKREFKPHVTTQSDRSMKKNTHFICDRLYIVEQHGDYKQIVGEAKFHT